MADVPMPEGFVERPAEEPMPEGFTEQPVEPPAPVDPTLPPSGSSAPAHSNEVVGFTADQLSAEVEKTREEKRADDSMAQWNRLNAAFASPLFTSEDDAASTLSISKRLGIPTETVRANLKEFRATAEEAEFNPDEWVKRNPRLAKLLNRHHELAPSVLRSKTLGNTVIKFEEALSWVKEKLGVLSEEDLAEDAKVAKVMAEGDDAEVRALEAELPADQTEQRTRVRREQDLAKATAPKQALEVDDPLAKIIREKSGLDYANALAWQRTIEGLHHNKRALRFEELGRARFMEEHGMTPARSSIDIEFEIHDEDLKFPTRAFGDDTGAARLEGVAAQGVSSTLGAGIAAAKAGGVGFGVGAVLGGAVTGAITRNPAAALEGAVGMGKLVGGKAATGAAMLEMYRYETGASFERNLTARTEEGKLLTNDEAMGGAVLEGLFKSALEGFSFSKQAQVFKGALPGAVKAALQRDPTFRRLIAKVAKDYFESIATETVTEGLQQAVEQAGEYLTKSAAEGRLQDAKVFRPGEIVGASEGGFMGAVALGALPAAITTVSTPTVQKSSRLALERTADARAEKADQVVGPILDMAAEPLAQGAAPEFAGMIKEASAEHGAPIESLHVDAQAVRAYFQKDGPTVQDEALIDATGDETAPQRLADALEQGTKFEIPIQQVLASWGASQLGKAMRDHTSTSATALSPLQREEQKAALKEQAKQVEDELGAELTQEEELDAEREKIEQSVTEQRGAKEGKRIGTLFAHFWRTSASEFRDLTPADIAQTFLTRFFEGDNLEQSQSGRTEESLVDPGMGEAGDPMPVVGEDAGAAVLEATAEMSPDQRARALFIDKASGLRSERAWNMTPRTPGKQVLVLTTADMKAINDDPSGGHDTTNDLLRVIGREVVKFDPRAALAGPDFRLEIDPGKAEEVRAAVQAALPPGIVLDAGVGTTAEEASKAAGASVDAKRASGEYGARGSTKFDTAPLKAPGFRFSKEEDAFTGGVSDDLMAHVASGDVTPGAFEDQGAFIKEAMYDPKMPGVLSKTGFEAVGERDHVMALDGVGLRDLNLALGKEAGNVYLAIIASIARDLGGEGLFFAHLSGDEYAAKSDDRAVLESFARDLQAELRQVIVEATAADGKKYRITPAVRHGIGEKTYGNADRALNADKRAEAARGVVRGSAFAEVVGDSSVVPRRGNLEAVGRRAEARRGDQTNAVGARAQGEDAEFDPEALSPGSTRAPSKSTHSAEQMTEARAAVERMQTRNRLRFTRFLDFVEGWETGAERPAGMISPAEERKFAKRFGIVDPETGFAVIEGQDAGANPNAGRKKNVERSTAGKERQRDQRLAFEKNVLGRVNQKDDPKLPPHKIEASFWGEDNRRLTVEITTPEGREMGRADIDVVGETLHVAGIITEPGFRRQGVATALLRKAQEVSGKKVSFEDTTFTESGRKFAEGARLFQPDDDFRDSHRAPKRGDNSPASDLTQTGTYPADVYGANGQRFYGFGTTDDKLSGPVFKVLREVRGKPDALVSVFRAVPLDVKARELVRGDWVSLSKQYAADHGERRFDGKYRVIEQKVRAGDIFTNGDSIFEFGFDPAKEGQTQTPEFKAWFKNSKVVDSKGEPLVVFHGTKESFDAFDPKRIGSNFSADSRGFFFTTNKNDANDYASGDTIGLKSDQPGANVMPVFVSLQKPLIIDDAFLKSEGMDPIGVNDDTVTFWDNFQNFILEKADEAKADGVILVDNTYRPEGEPTKLVVAFKPQQVKSAIGNRGTFSKTSPNIRFQPGDEKTPGQSNPKVPKGYTLMPTAAQGRRIFDVFLNAKSDASTAIHEAGHVFLEIMGELAARADAGARTRQKWLDTLKWMGTTEEKWSALNQEEKTVLHEKFAEAFEVYAAEGSAPSLSLEGVFVRFRDWMLEVFRTLKAQRAPINDNIRSVFDRMLATDDEIRRHLGQRGRPLFDNAKDAGMTDSQWADKLEADAESRHFANRKVWLRAKREQLREKDATWKEELRAEEKAAEKRYDKLPAVIAMSVLDGTLADTDAVVLDRKQVVDAVGRKASRRFRTSVTGGRNIDEVGIAAQFPNGKAMLEAVSALPGREEWVAAEADAAMKKKHGDLLTERTTLQKEVAGGLHEYVEKQQLEEWAALNRGIKPGMGAPVVPAEAIRDAAGNMISRRAVKALSGARVLAAERTAATAKAAHAAKGEFDMATAAAKRQLLNSYLYRETLKALDEKEELEDLAKRLAKTSSQAKLGKASKEYRDAANFILETLGLKSPTGVTSDGVRGRAVVDRAVAEMNGSGFAIGDPEWKTAFDGVLTGQAAYRTGDRMAPLELGNLTVLGMRAVKDALKSLDAAANARNTILREGKRVDIERSEAEIIANLESIKSKKPTPATKGTETVGEQLRGLLSQADGFLRNPIDKLRELVDDDQESEAFKVLVNPVRAAKYRENALMHKVIEPIIKAMERMSKETRANLRAPLPADLFPEHTTDFSPPRYRHELLVMALNYGNESNAQRLRDGRNVTDAQVKNALNLLTKEELAWVQQVFDSAELLRPEAFALEERLSGLPVKAIKARPLALANGNLAGGYFPVVYERAASVAGEKQEAGRVLDPNYTRPNTPHSHLKGRADKVEAVISLAVGNVYRGLAQTAHDIAFREALLSGAAMVLRPKVQKALKERMGPDGAEQFMRWYTDIGGAQRGARNVHERAVSWIRSNMAPALLGFRPSTALGDFANLLAAVPSTALKLHHLSSGLNAYLEAPLKSRELALSKSEELRFMENHLRKMYDEHLRDFTQRGLLERGPAATRAVGRGISQSADWLKDNSFFFMETVAKVTATPVWLGAYRQALTEGKPEAEAVRWADDILTQVFPSHSAVEQSALLRDKGYVGLTTVFGGYLNTVYRANARLASPLFTTAFEHSSLSGKAKTIGGVAASLLAFTVAWQLFGELFMGKGAEAGDDDEEDPESKALRWRNWAGRKLLTGPLQTLPLISEVANTIDAKLTGRQTHGRGGLVAEWILSLGKGLSTLADEDKETLDKLEAVWRLLGAWKGMPQGMNKSLRYLLEVGLGDRVVEKSGRALGGGIYGERDGQPDNVPQAVGDALAE